MASARLSQLIESLRVLAGRGDPLDIWMEILRHDAPLLELEHLRRSATDENMRQQAELLWRRFTGQAFDLCFRDLGIEARHRNLVAFCLAATQVEDNASRAVAAGAVTAVLNAWSLSDDGWGVLSAIRTLMQPTDLMPRGIMDSEIDYHLPEGTPFRGLLSSALTPWLAGMLASGKLVKMALQAQVRAFALGTDQRPLREPPQRFVAQDTLNGATASLVNEAYEMDGHRFRLLLPSGNPDDNPARCFSSREAAAVGCMVEGALLPARALRWLEEAVTAPDRLGECHRNLVDLAQHAGPDVGRIWSDTDRFTVLCQANWLAMAGKLWAVLQPPPHAIALVTYSLVGGILDMGHGPAEWVISPREEMAWTQNLTRVEEGRIAVVTAPAPFPLQ